MPPQLVWLYLEASPKTGCSVFKVSFILTPHFHLVMHLNFGLEASTVELLEF
jgi:hypothetical protein